MRKLGERIPWRDFEEAFGEYYSEEGRPAKPVRLMVGLLFLKQMYDQSDEDAVDRWVENPYWQQFCGMSDFQWQLPCDPSDLVYFRQRIGEQGVALILAVSTQMHGERAQESEVVVDSTAQAQGSTPRPEEAAHHSRSLNARTGAKAARSRPRRIRRELHPLPSGVGPEPQDIDKIYSLHEPHIYCVAKGKQHKKYEFGTKASVAMTKTHGVIVAAVAHERNLYDAHTLPEVLDQAEAITDIRAQTRYRGSRLPRKKIC